jgi:hypothetical protein
MKHALAPSAAGFALLVVAAAARAQSTPLPPPLTATLTGSAKTDYDTARVMLAQHDFEGALVRFTRLYEQVHDARLVADIALCEKSLSHCARATTLFDEALSIGAALFSPSQTADIRAMVQACSPRVGRVHIVGAPAAATVEIDGAVVEPGAPSRDFVVEPGTHHVRVSMNGYRDRVTSIAVAGGVRAELAANLQPAAVDQVAPVRGAALASPDKAATVGALAVRAGPNDTIALDGRVLGVHSWQGRVATGQHSIAVGAEGMTTYRADIEITEDQTRTLDVTLAEPRGAPAWMWATGAGLVVTGVIVAIVSVFRPANPIGPAPAGVSTPQAGLRRR